MRRAWVVLALTGCGAAHTPAARTEPDLAVIEAGAEPRSPMRFQLAPGTSARVSYRSHTTITNNYTTTTLEEGRQTREPPTVQLVTRLQVTSVMPTGEAVIAADVEELGVRGSYRVAPSGRVLDISFRAPDPAAQNRLGNLAAAIKETGAEFPAQPIGVGAVWQVRSTVELSGVTWQSVATHTLRGFDQDVATIETSTTLRAGSQALRTEPHASIRLTSGEATFTGQSEVSLRDLRQTVTGRSASELNLLIVRGKHRLTSTLHTTTELASETL